MRTMEQYVKDWWKAHPNFGNPELRANGQFDEIPYVEFAKIERRIAAWDYPFCECRYGSIKEWEEATGLNFEEDI